MSKKMKIVMGLVFSFIIIVAGAIFFALSKIDKEQIKNLAISSIEKALPGTNVSISDIDIDLGLSIELHLNQFRIELKPEIEKFADQKLFSVKSVDLKIPVWTILTGGGEITVKIDQPKMNYFEKLEKKNWLLALGDEQSKPKAPVGQEEDLPKRGQLKTSEVPSFIQKSKLNIRLEEMILAYQLNDQSSGSIVVDKIVFKDIGFTKTMAYELSSQLNINLQPKENYQARILLIGQLDLPHYLQNQEIKTSLVTTITSQSLTGLDFNIPDIKNKLNVLVDKDMSISLDSDTEIKNLLDLKNKIYLKGEKLSLKKINGVFYLNEIKSFLPKEHLSSLAGLNLNKSSILINGTLDYDLERSLLNPKLNYNLSAPISYQFMPGNDITFDFSGEMNNKNTLLKISNKFLSGLIDTDISLSSYIDLSKDPLKSIEPINISTSISNVKISQKFLEQLSPKQSESSAKSGNKNKESTEKEQNKKKVAKKIETPQPDFPVINFTLDIDPLLIEKEAFKLSTMIKIAKNRIESKKGDLNFGKGTGKFSFNTDLLKDEGIKGAMAFNMKGLDLSVFNPFLPSMIQGIEGIYSGLFAGNFSMIADVLKYNFKMDINAVDGKIKNLNLSEYILPSLEKIPMIKDKVSAKDLKITDEFKKFQFQGDATEVQVHIKKGYFDGLKNSAEINAKGIVFMDENYKKQQSQVDMTIQDKTGKLSAILEKEAGTQILPIRLKGFGMNLLPDYQYTLEILGKSALNIQKKKAVNKVKEKAVKKIEDKILGNKKVKEKINDNLKDKAKDKLKGLFR